MKKSNIIATTSLLCSTLLLSMVPLFTVKAEAEEGTVNVGEWEKL